MSGGIFNVFIVFLLSSVKFLLAPGLSVGLGFGFGKTIIITTLGGVSGVFIFYYFGAFIFSVIDKIRGSKPKPKKPVFTRKKRMFVKFKVKYGLPGLALLTPTIISIPIGTIIAARYFHNPFRTIPVLSISVFLWSLFLTTIVYYFKVSFQ